MKAHKNLAIALSLAAASSASAVNARHELQTFSQPDGTTVELRRVGDENAHFLATEDNQPVVMANGRFEFATLSDGALRSTGLAATSSAHTSSLAPSAILRTLAETNAVAERPVEGLMSAGFPTVGEVPMLVVLVEYQDVAFNLSDSKAYYEGILNESGYREYGCTGSAREYFESNSNGLFSPRFEIVGPVKLPHERAYYGANNSRGGDGRAYEMAVDAAALIDAEVDFSRYDTNGDNFVDNVFVIYAGQGEASYGGPETVWPFSSELTRRQVYKQHDGVYLNRIACTNEWLAKRPDGVGTFIHEMSHVLGLPDLYNTSDLNSISTPGDWSVMDYGSYNNNGCTPPNYSAYERASLGWLDPVELNGNGSHEILPLHSDNDAAMICIPGKENEYFILENRRKEGWDAYLPGEGMLVWHIDFDAAWFSANKVNINESHPRVDIVEASGKVDCLNTSTLADYTWGRPGAPTALGFDTTPRLAGWDDEDPGVRLSDIHTTAEGNVAFEVACDHLPTTFQLENSGVATAEVEGMNIEGLTVTLPGNEIALYTTDGRRAAAGFGSATAPCAGLYIVKTADKAVKTYLR